MTKYTFNVNGKSMTIDKKSITKVGKKTRKPKQPDCSREHLEDTLAKWSFLENPSAQQNISMRGRCLQINAGHMTNRVACGQGRYKVTIFLPYLIQAYNELYWGISSSILISVVFLFWLKKIDFPWFRSKTNKQQKIQQTSNKQAIMSTIDTVRNWQLVAGGAGLATLQVGSVQILARSTVIAVMNEIKSEETQRLIDLISKQYYGEYDPRTPRGRFPRNVTLLRNAGLNVAVVGACAEEHDDEEEEVYDTSEEYDTCYGGMWGIGQNGEQWSSDI